MEWNGLARRGCPDFKSSTARRPTGYPVLSVKVLIACHCSLIPLCKKSEKPLSCGSQTRTYIYLIWFILRLRLRFRLRLRLCVDFPQTFRWTVTRTVLWTNQMSQAESLGITGFLQNRAFPPFSCPEIRQTGSLRVICGIVPVQSGATRELHRTRLLFIGGVSVGLSYGCSAGQHRTGP